MTLLREIAPDVRHVGILFNPDSAANAASFFPSLNAAASALGMRQTTLHVRDDAEIKNVVRTFAESNAGLIALPDPFLSVRREMIASEASRRNYRPSTHCAISQRQAGCSHMASTPSLNTRMQRPMWTAFFEGLRPPTFRYRLRVRSRWS